MEKPQAAKLWIVSSVVCSIFAMQVLVHNAFACEPDCGPCMHWVGPLPPQTGGHCELNAGATCAEDSDCGTCGRCGGSPCSCSADVQLCNLECDVCDTETQDCYDEDSLCGTENCLDCIAGTCEDRCENTETPYCDNPNDQCVECVNDGDCSTGYECVEGECRQPCTYDYDCGNCEDCVDGYCSYVCVETEVCVNGTCAPESGGCQPSCGEDEICVNGECAPGTGGGDCDPECQPDEICANGECVPEGTGCTPTCGAEEDCVNGECIPSPAPGPCQPPCDSGEICVNSACVPNPGGCNPVCDSDEMCVNGTCIPNGSGCEPACQPGMSCVDGDCVPDGSGCDPACAPGYTCTNGQCVPPGACQPACDPGETCVNGECTTPPPPPCPECQVRDLSGQCVNHNGASCSSVVCGVCNNGSCQEPNRNCPECQEWSDTTCKCENITGGSCSSVDCGVCSNGSCVDSCPPQDLVCKAETDECVECLSDSDCDGTCAYCDTSSNTCGTVAVTSVSGPTGAHCVGDVATATAVTNHELTDGCSIEWGGDASFGATTSTGTTHETSATLDTLGTNLKVNAKTTAQSSAVDQSGPFSVITVTAVIPDSGYEYDDNDGDDNTRAFMVNKSPSGYITVYTLIEPVVPESQLPGCWSLTGGIGSGQLSRTVRTAVPGKHVVKADCCGIEKTTTIYVVACEFGAYADCTGVGHAWWKLGVSVSDGTSDPFPQDLQKLYPIMARGWACQEAGYRSSTGGPIAPGLVSSDSGHEVTASHTWEITADNHQEAASFVADLSANPGTYNIITNN